MSINLKKIFCRHKFSCIRIFRCIQKYSCRQKFSGFLAMFSLYLTSLNKQFWIKPCKIGQLGTFIHLLYCSKGDWHDFLVWSPPKVNRITSIKNKNTKLFNCDHLALFTLKTEEESRTNPSSSGVQNWEIISHLLFNQKMPLPSKRKRKNAQNYVLFIYLFSRPYKNRSKTKNKKVYVVVTWYWGA